MTMGIHMEAMAYSTLRQNLAKMMGKVCADRTPIIITRKKNDSVVMMPLEDYEAMEETAHLLSTPQNANRLLESIAELNAGGGQERKLVD